MDTTNNQNVFELAITLGKALKQDARLVRMDNARKAYEEDPTLKTLMTEYDVQQKAIQVASISFGGPTCHYTHLSLLVSQSIQGSPVLPFPGL